MRRERLILFNAPNEDPKESEKTYEQWNNSTRII